MYIFIFNTVTGIVINTNNCHQDLTFGILSNSCSVISNNQVSGSIGWPIQFVEHNTAFLIPMHEQF